MKSVYLLFILPFMPINDTQLTEHELYCYIKKIGIQHPEIVLKQAIYETGHFKSNIYKTKNNLFGFRRTSKYMQFESWKKCVEYYKKWQEKHYTNTTLDYYKFLELINYSGYKNFNYSQELKKIKIKDTSSCFVNNQVNNQ